MRLRGLVAAALLLLISACAFHSDRPLFRESEAATPFADGARFLWREGNDGEARTVVYRRVGRGYEISAEEDTDDQVMRVLFIRANDMAPHYILQVQMGADEPGRIYAFAWRTQTGLRIIAAPSVVRAVPTIGPLMMERNCVPSPNGECRLITRDNVLGIGSAAFRGYALEPMTPEDYIDQTPISNNPSLPPPSPQQFIPPL
jgi:hypothetical protein